MEKPFLPIPTSKPKPPHALTRTVPPSSAKQDRSWCGEVLSQHQRGKGRRARLHAMNHEALTAPR
eukprot:scaffold37178_cov66-Skeletonema_marinoi.AAC.1